jgi:phenylalanine ammonia-lyase
MEKMRQNLESIGRILFAQTTEMVNPATNKGLPPNLVSCEPSESWLFKTVDIMLAALQGELGFLAHPVNHVHTTELGNQSIHSLALISARYTHMALGILSQIIASHLLMVCQALDLRAMQSNFLVALEPHFNDMLQARLGPLFMSTKNEGPEDHLKVTTLHKQLWSALPDLLDNTTNMDSDDRFLFVAASLQPLILAHSFGEEFSESATSFTQHLSTWKIDCGRLMKEQFLKNRSEYSVNADATPYLGRASKRMYRFIRQDLKIPFLRTEDLAEAEDLVEAEDLGQFESSMNEGPVPASTGNYITKIHEALRNGVLYVPAMECLQEALIQV